MTESERQLPPESDRTPSTSDSGEKTLPSKKPDRNWPTGAATFGHSSPSLEQLVSALKQFQNPGETQPVGKSLSPDILGVVEQNKNMGSTIANQHVSQKPSLEESATPREQRQTFFRRITNFLSRSK